MKCQGCVGCVSCDQSFSETERILRASQVLQYSSFQRKEKAKVLAKKIVKLQTLTRQSNFVKEEIEELEGNTSIGQAQLFLEGRIFRLEDALKRAEEDLKDLRAYRKEREPGEDEPFI